MFPRCSLILNRVGGLSAAWEPVSSAVTLQCVRWRKMRTDPKAKSKINYKRIPTPVDSWEHEFMTRKNAHYRTITRAIRKMFQEEQEQKLSETAEGGSAEERETKERQEHLRALEWNDQENARTKALREERLTTEARVRDEKRLERMMKMEEKQRQTLEELEERVRQEKEASKSYITLDNMEEAIVNSLADSKEYNFSISRKGEILLPDNTAWKELKSRQHTDSDSEEILDEHEQKQ